MRPLLLFTVLLLSVGCDRSKPKDSKQGGSTTQQIVEPARDDRHNYPEILDLDEAIRKNPKDADLYHKRGYAWHARGDFKQVYRDYGEAIRLNPNNPAYYDSRGFAYHMDNRQEAKALADYTEALRLDPKFVNALNNRAYLLATTLQDQYRDGKKALKDALLACELTQWKNSGYLDTLAVAYAETGDFEQAIRWQEKALEDRSYAESSGEQARKQIDLFKQRKPYRE